ncbi:MAG TPA: hypothetical protein VFU31_00560 [Candidatus Binatia bacterium]|nr:hypothetical protein [Candidatus Binatia bacterium]
MVDMRILEASGCTQERLKEKLTGDPRLLQGKPADLVNRIRSRCQEGRSRNFLDYKTYWALDQAWDTPFRQVNPTLMSMFQDADTSDPEVINKMKEMGLSDLITEQIDPKSGKPTQGKQVANLPIFFSVIVPLVRSYVTVRWAKIVNDRRLIPFFKYEPAKVTTPLRAKCEVLTDRVQVMSNQYGYFDVMKQAVLKMLHYSFCFQFPKEGWHSEFQWRYATAEDVQAQKKDENGNVVTEGQKIKVTDREGLRYEHPHPTRVFWDLAHGKHTFNSDSGCEYAGYWRVARYKEILDSPDVWNKNEVVLGSTDIVSANRAFFQSVYGACTLTCPVFSPQVKGNEAAGAAGHLGSSELDREKALANQYYGTDQKDQGVLVTEYFEKLVPKDYDLGDYDCPVWFRFLLAGDAATVLFAEPLAYPPVLYYGYDADENRAKNASMSLEILPFQDLFSNTLTQINLTARQNLANATFVDTDQLTDDSKKKIQNLGEKLFRVLNIFTFSSKAAARAQNKIVEVSHSASFPKGNVGELTNVLKTILDILDRVMVMSQQEVAQAASHEQTREEIRNIAQTTSSRLQFTSTPVDIARDAWKRQLYMGLMAHGDDDIYALLPSEIKLDKPALQKLGFTYVDNDEMVKNDRYKEVRTTKKFIALPLWSFSSTRDGDDRASDQQTAQALAMLWDKVMNNPITAQAVGPDQAIEWANQIGRLAGLDRDFKLRNSAGTPEEQQAEAQGQLKEAIAMVMQQVDQKIAEAGGPVVEEIQKLAEQTVQNSQAIGQLVKLAQEAMPMAGA